MLKTPYEGDIGRYSKSIEKMIKIAYTVVWVVIGLVGSLFVATVIEILTGLPRL